jgi:GAF domain-containing protein
MAEREDVSGEFSPLLGTAPAGEAIARIERLQRLTAALASAATAAECAQALSTAGRAALEAQAAFVWLVDARGVTLELAASDGYRGPELETYKTIALDGTLPVCDALRSGEPIFLESPDDRLERYPVVGDGARAGFKSWAAIPFLLQGRSIGALSLSFDRPSTPRCAPARRWSRPTRPRTSSWPCSATSCATPCPPSSRRCS